MSFPLISPLIDDVLQCHCMIQEKDSQFARRCYVRAAFAFIEGYFYHLREIVLEGLITRTELNPRNGIPVHQIALLKEEIPRLDSTGNLKTDISRYPSMNQFAFILRSFTDVTQFDVNKVFGVNEWRELKLAMDIRHRITHPKNSDSLEITDDDLARVRRSVNWVHNILGEIISSGSS